MAAKKKPGVKKSTIEIPDPRQGQSTGRDPAPRKRSRRWLAATLICVALIAAAYGAAALQGTLALRRAQTAWKDERDRMSATIETQTRELVQLKSQKALWRLDSGLSEVVAHLADKNFGLARDSTQALSTALAELLAGSDEATKSKLQPLSSLLEDVGQSADAVSKDARVKAQMAKSFIDKILESDGSAPAGDAAPAGSAGSSSQ